MSVFGFVCLLFVVISSAVTDASKNTRGEENIHHRLMTIQNRDDIVGVSSVAGVTSSNGKVSSIGGVKFYPAPGKSNQQSGGTMIFAYPFNANKGMTTGSIRINPGSVAVSSSSYNTKFPERKNWQPIHPMFDEIVNWPMMNDFVFPPQGNIFDPTINIDPWFSKNLINSFTPLRPDIRNAWLYPNLNPFLNMWDMR